MRISQLESSQCSEYKFRSKTQSEGMPNLVSALFLASSNIPYFHPIT